MRAGCKFMGMVAAPDDAYRVLRHIRTLPFRLQTQVCVTAVGRRLCGDVRACCPMLAREYVTTTRTHAQPQACAGSITLICADMYASTNIFWRHATWASLPRPVLIGRTLRLGGSQASFRRATGLSRCSTSRYRLTPATNCGGRLAGGRPRSSAFVYGEALR